MFCEEVLLNNSARIFRIGRKVCGLTQIDVANAIGSSQSSVSKYEAGILQPSALDWFNFCALVNLDSTKALKDGYIDNCLRIKELFYKDMGFRIPRRYKRSCCLKVREMLPMLRNCILQFGESGLDELLRKLEMDPDYFFVYDAPLSLYFLEDFVNALPRKGVEFLPQAADLAGDLALHGELKEYYLQAANASSMGLAFVEKEYLYEDVFDVDKLLERNKQTLVFVPKEDIATEASPQFWDTYTNYKVEALKHLISRNSRLQEEPRTIHRPKGRGLEVRLTA